MSKHGNELHFVRPDRVYATSVLTPIVGYQPASDAYQVGARFVAGGQGLAGPRSETVQPSRFYFRRNGFRFRRNGVAGPVDTIRGWLSVRFAGLRAWLSSMKIRKELTLPPGTDPSQPTHEMDTSPRGPQPYSGAVPVQAGWAPPPQSPLIAALKITRDKLFKAPVLPAEAAGGQIAPAAAFAPNRYVSDMMSGLPPVVAQRGEDDLLRRFYANRLPGAGY
jgi:hypothetical protein